jgi:hypothetical protein
MFLLITDHCSLITVSAAQAAVEKRNWMSRVYEVMFIVRPDVVDEELDKLIAG